MAPRQTGEPGKSGKGKMTVEEAGNLGGEKRGKKGGQRVRELIQEGKRVESEGGPATSGKSKPRH